ncbi:hypothetical protein [Roseimaritima sediminicola]|uniref:hypothetical protein n=1 Tax=Roseimaritima sediminicola TaxID=2662066 RepID=UPI0012985715|nr:hypothetical protein [Roseimaritima sediminicola]
MKRIVLAGLAGAVIYYVWQLLAWMVLPIHGPTVGPLVDEDTIRDAVIAQDLDTGVYVVPYGSSEAMMDPASEYRQRHQQGPIFTLFVHREGGPPMPPTTMLLGFLTDFLGASIVATLLCCAAGGCCCKTYLQRVGFVSGFGVFLALMGHVAYFNWMWFPAHYTAMFVLDVIVGWFLAGLAIAAIIKPSDVCDTPTTIPAER